MLVHLPRGHRLHLDFTFPPIAAALRAVPWRKVGRAAAITAALLGAVAVFAAVAGPSFVASYRHAQTVFHRYGETEAMSAWLPLTTDGMLVAAIFVIYYRRARRERVGFLPVLAFVSGMIATLAANLAAADLSGPLSLDLIVGRVATATWPPICLALTLELAANLIKGGESARPRRRRLFRRSPAPATPVKRERPPAAEKVEAPKPTSTKAPKPRAGRLSDDEWVEKIRAWMAETGQASPSKWAIRQHFGMGNGVADRVYPLLGLDEKGAA